MYCIILKIKYHEKNDFIIALLLSTLLHSQTGVIQDTIVSGPLCQVPQQSNNLDQLGLIKGLDVSLSLSLQVKIYIHVLKKEAEPHGGQTVEGVNRLLNNLYDVFDPHQIHFSWDGVVNSIYNNDYYHPNSNNIDALFSENSHANGIDLYLTDFTESFVSYSHGIGNDTNVILGGYLSSVYNGPKGDSFTAISYTNYLAHLLGHTFMLFHTHHGQIPNDGGCPELVDGSNSNVCGDYIGDTPADPNLYTYPPGRINVDSNCNFDPQYYNPNPPVDANGEEYLPDTRNYMSNTFVQCEEHFTYDQVKVMKGAILSLPHLQVTELTEYIYIRPLEDCYVCPGNSKFFNVFTTADPSSLTVLSSSNVDTNIIEVTSNSIKVRVESLIPSTQEGEQGFFSVYSSASPTTAILTKQPIWVGRPQTVPDAILFGTGDDDIPKSPGTGAYHILGDLLFRLGGTETYGWDYPAPNTEYNFGENDGLIWRYFDYNKYFPQEGSFLGSVTDWVRGYGVNPCGEGYFGEYNEICVKNWGDGAPECDAPEPPPIIYYPNPANSLLQVDLSLQAYKTYEVVIYDEYQTVKYSDQSTNILKTVDVFNLINGTYYLHVYDGGENILSRILVINH